MRKLQHTPAPWILDGDSIFGKNGDLSAFVTELSKYADTKAKDLQLIVAAPALLEALLIAKDCLEEAKIEHAYVPQALEQASLDTIIDQAISKAID